MSDSLFSDVSSVTAKAALDGLSLRQQVISRNLANIDTPGYQAQTVDFQETLSRLVETNNLIPLTLTDEDHLTTAEASGLQTVSLRPGGSYRADQNNVDIDVEMADMSEAGHSVPGDQPGRLKKIITPENTRKIMIPSALQLTSTIPPLDGTVSKLQAADLEAQSVSFSEILKVEEKKLQQEISSASAAAVLATMQPPALPVFTPIPANGNTEAESSAQSKPTVDSVSIRTIAPNIQAEPRSTRVSAAPLEGNFTSTVFTGAQKELPQFTLPAETVTADMPFPSSNREMNPVKDADLKQPTVATQTQTPLVDGMRNLITQEPFSMDGSSLPREYKAQVTKVTVSKSISSQPVAEVMHSNADQPAAKIQAATAEVSLPKEDRSPAVKVTVSESVSNQPIAEVMRGNTDQPATKIQADVSLPKEDRAPASKVTVSESVSNQPIAEVMRGNADQPAAKTQAATAEVSLPKEDRSPAAKVAASESVSNQPTAEVMRGNAEQPAAKTQAATAKVSLPEEDRSPAAKVTVFESVSNQPTAEVMRGNAEQPAAKIQAATAEVSLPKEEYSPAAKVTVSESASSQSVTEVMHEELPQPESKAKSSAPAPKSVENIKSTADQPAMQQTASTVPDQVTAEKIEKRETTAVTVENHDAVQRTEEPLPRAKIQPNSANKPVEVDMEAKAPVQELANNIEVVREASVAEIPQTRQDTPPAAITSQGAVSIPEQKTANVETKDSAEKITLNGDKSAARTIVENTPARKQEIPSSTTDVITSDLQEVDQTPTTSPLKTAAEPIAKAATSASTANDTEAVSTSQKDHVQNNGEMLGRIKTDQPADGILSEAAGSSTVKEETDVPFEVKKIEEKKSSIKTNQTESSPQPLQTQSVGAADRTSKTQVKSIDADITQQIMSELKPRIQKGEMTLHMQLNPKELGSIDIEMTKGPHGMQVSFVTEQASTGQLLESQVNQLKQSLKEAGVQLANLNISQHGQPKQEGGYRQEQTFVPFNGRDAPLAAKEENLRPLTSVSPHEIDYLV